MALQFTKMHGLGNDFMVIDAINQSIQCSAKQIKQLSCRHTGIGFDQCLVLEKSDRPGIDFFYRIFNADGSTVGQCGNGARCLARFIQHYGFSSKTSLTVATTTTELQLHLNSDQTVTVDMGTPVWAPNPEIKPGLTMHALTIGNPHVVIPVDDIYAAPIKTLGPEIETHMLFPEQTNVGFAEFKAPNHIQLRVHERGAGETNACGSGAVAAAAVGRRFYDLDKIIRVSLPGGDLTVEWPDMADTIKLTGPATFIYEGKLL
ncbi:MAG: diaminopimelate epimerase [Gammaproteobacteria bacterium]|nr:diaminopimelate epimerase [Gammaproteobacteria bacterium]MCH9764105.1 diaminopimelate epimerase [Gammaproteobacteria bacterium]